MQLQIHKGQSLGIEQISQVKLKRQIDPIMGRLIPDVMTVRLRRGQSLQVETGLQKRVQLFDKGKLLTTQFIRSCLQEGSIQKLESRTDLDFLQLEFRGGLYTEKTVDQMMGDILGDRGYVIDEGIDPLVSGHIPICNRQEALAMLTFAQGGCMKMDPNGYFRMGFLNAETPELLGPDRILDGPVMLSLPEYSRVELVAHSYKLANNWVQIFGDKEFFSSNETYTFTEPVAQYRLLHGEILESGHNYVTFQPMDTDTLHTLPYLHSRKWLSDSQLPGRDRVLSVRDNALIGSHNESRMLEGLKQRTQWNHKLKLRIYVNNEEPGQPVAVDTPWGSRFAGVITRMDSILTPERHTAEITVCGREI